MKMRISKRRSRGWDFETLTCSISGHNTPAAHVRSLRDTDGDLGVDASDGTRLSRCLRCIAWTKSTPDTHLGETLSEVEPLELPKRGHALRNMIVMRAISIEKAIQFTLLLLLIAGLLIVEYNLGGLKNWANVWLDAINELVSSGRRGVSNGLFQRWLTHLEGLKTGTIHWFIVVAAGFALIEAIEGIGLWFGKRWVEYLTVVETALFLPLEIRELWERITITRVLALGINIVIIIYLVWSNRLFGIERWNPIPNDEPIGISPRHFRLET